MSKGTDAVATIGKVFAKVDTVIDAVAPWLGPIGIGLKVAVCFVGLFVTKKKEMSAKDIGKENLRLNKMILKDCSDILNAVKKVELYMKYERDLKKFRSYYQTYRNFLFQEGEKVAWKYMNDGTLRSEI